MSKRSTPQRMIDEGAFPIRIKIIVPGHGLGVMLDEIYAWLGALGPDEWAWHSAAVYFRSIANAAKFFERFPTLEMADSALRRSRPGRIT